MRNSLIAWALVACAPLKALGADAGPDFGPDAGVDDAAWKEFPIDDDAAYETVVKGKPISEEGLSRTRINHQDLKRRGSATVAEAVEHEPAVFASSGKKGERTFRMRGFDQHGVAVYFDGVPFSMPYSGTTDLGKIPIEMVDSILVLKGPTSIVHGPGGMGGAVLIETRSPGDGLSVETQAEAGGNLESKYSLYHSFNPGPFAYSIGAGSSLSNGYRLSSQFEPTYYEDGGVLDNSGRRINHLAGKVVVPVPGSNEISTQSFFVDGAFGIPRSTTDNRPFFSRFNVWRASVNQLAHRLERGGLVIEEAFFVGAYKNRLDSFDDDTFSTMDGPNAYRSWYRDYTVGGRIRMDYSLKGLPAGSTHLRLWLGGQHDVHRSRLDTDEPEDKFRRTLLTAVPEVEIPIVRGLVGLASAQVDADLPDTSDAVIETDDEYEDRPHVVFGPLVSLRWDPADALMARLVGARRNRIPTLSERYSARLGFSEPNPNLNPESAWYVGLDVDWKVADVINFAVSAFDAEVMDKIESQYLPEMNGVTQKQNIGRARLAGCEASVDFHPVRAVRLTAGYAYLYARRLDNTDEEDRIAQIPAHQAVFGLVYGPLDWLEMASYFRIVGPQAFDDYNILGLGELGTYSVWDARLEARPLPNVTIWTKGMNLLDMNYQTEYGYPDRGISVWAGFAVTLDKSVR
jgi:iron complex outermembrane receptor protein